MGAASAGSSGAAKGPPRLAAGRGGEPAGWLAAAVGVGPLLAAALNSSSGGKRGVLPPSPPNAPPLPN
eukprot:7388767-Prymnesium_polylepis.1